MIKVNNLTDMFHIEITFEDVFSFAKAKRQTTVSGRTLLQMQDQIGQIVVNKFNPKTHTRDTLKLIEITQL
jgi:hypothetical protein